MTEAEVVALMASCNTYDDWYAACQRVKEAHAGGYPPYWYEEVIASGLHDEVRSRWGDKGPRMVVAQMDQDGKWVPLNDPNPGGVNN